VFLFSTQSIKEMTGHCLAENPNEACCVVLGKTLLHQFKDICANEFSIERGVILFDSHLINDLNLTHANIKKIITTLTNVPLETGALETRKIMTVLDSLEFVAQNGGGDIATSIVRITNTAKSPYRYQMDPLEFLDADKKAERLDLGIVAFYHSHTHSAAYPSDTDVRLAIESGWTDPYYVLVSLENIDAHEIKMYQINVDGTVIEKNYSLSNCS
jgi:proteasome lid subunit RPN8/RPN11